MPQPDTQLAGRGGPLALPETMTKSGLRLQARALRDCLPVTGAEALASHLVGYLAGGVPRVIGGYWPIGSEIDPRPAMWLQRDKGARLALPFTPQAGLPLTFRLWEGALVPGRFGTAHPDGLDVVPDVFLVPLLAFDRSGQRLGYGGGYYDRTLAAWPRVAAIGCAYAAQEVPSLPQEPHDRKLSAIITEAGIVYPSWQHSAER